MGVGDCAVAEVEAHGDFRTWVEADLVALQVANLIQSPCHNFALWGHWYHRHRSPHLLRTVGYGAEQGVARWQGTSSFLYRPRPDLKHKGLRPLVSCPCEPSTVL